jgi:hypothetical protein
MKMIITRSNLSSRYTSPERTGPKADDPNTSIDLIVGMIEITRKLASSIGNVFASLFDNLFAWFWFATLLVVVAVVIIFATSIKMVGAGEPSLAVVVATIGGMLLVAAGGGWAWHKFGEARAIRLGGLLVSLILPAAIVGVAIRLWRSWDVPDIWDRPLAALTLADIGQNVLKLIVLFWGVSFISAVVRKLFSDWRKG